MRIVLTRLYHDEAGFIISAELVLVSTIAVLSMVVGLSELASNINQELEDVASAFGGLNQSFRFHGNGGDHGRSSGGRFWDSVDDGDDDCDIFGTPPEPEGW